MEKEKRKKKVSALSCEPEDIPDDCPFLNFLFSLPQGERQGILDLMRRESKRQQVKYTIPPDLDSMTPEVRSAVIDDMNRKYWESY
ncbi:MAG: hypothetical protein HQL01_16100 [Nitrospirae bacterium]|nr:hypothetical protein [Nitrospirota bacterium]